jgi:hypothetical protein
MYKHCEASSSFQDWHEVGPVNRDDRGEQIDEWWDGGDEDGVCVGLFLVLTRSKEVLLSPCCKGCKWLTVVYKLLAVRDGEVVVGEEIPGKRREGVTSECG